MDYFIGKDGPAIEYPDGDKYWIINGKYHREDGPAIEQDGDKEWWVNGERHRLDGSAIQDSNGTKSWYIEDKKLTEEEFNNHPLVKNYQKGIK